MEAIDHQQRSEQQNKYYWAIVRYITREANKNGVLVSENIIHEAIKDQFGIQSTTGMNKYKFAKFTEDLRKYCKKELGITVPSAESFKILKFYNYV